MILDLSFPAGQAVNDGISKDLYLGQRIGLSYPGMDELVRMIVKMGRGCLMFKRDLKRAIGRSIQATSIWLVIRLMDT